MPRIFTAASFLALAMFAATLTGLARHMHASEQSTDSSIQRKVLLVEPAQVAPVRKIGVLA
jgi:hypothetical protein